MTSMDEKAAFLVREGLVFEHGGQLMLSSRAVALLTGTSEESWAGLARNRTEGRVAVPATFARDARRGAAEVRARLGTDDPFEVLYELAQPRNLRRPAYVDDELRELDGL